MISDDSVDEFNYSILKEENEKFSINGLSTAVIYGPNASGKSNFLNSLNFLKAIIENGGFKNFSNVKPFQNLNLIPNYLQDKVKNTEFKIIFNVDSDVYEYEVFIELGSFYDQVLSPKITYEKLVVNKSTVFIRDQLKIIELTSNSAYSNVNVELLSKTLRENTLFLTNGFSQLVDPVTAEKIINWFSNKLIVIPSLSNVEDYINLDLILFNKESQDLSYLDSILKVIDRDFKNVKN